MKKQSYKKNHKRTWAEKLEDNGLPPSEYHNYIQSEAWQRKRRQYFTSKMYNTYPAGKKAGKFVCYGCGADGNLHLHHKTYKRLGCELISVDLIPLCEKCHDKAHKKEKLNPKITLWTATKSVARSINKKINKPLKTKRERNEKLGKVKNWIRHNEYTMEELGMRISKDKKYILMKVGKAWRPIK